jgi:hypothetical protein
MPDPVDLGKQCASEGDINRLRGIMEQYNLNPDTLVHDSYGYNFSFSSSLPSFFSLLLFLLFFFFLLSSSFFSLLSASLSSLLLYDSYSI